MVLARPAIRPAGACGLVISGSPAGRVCLVVRVRRFQALVVATLSGTGRRGHRDGHIPSSRSDIAVTYEGRPM